MERLCIKRTQPTKKVLARQLEITRQVVSLLDRENAELKEALAHARADAARRE
jgi:hypothetical protein